MCQPSVLRFFSVRRKAFAILSLAIAACAPDAGVVDMAVLQWNPDTGVYELREARLTTLEDVAALRGAAATPIGDAEIVIEGGRLANVSTEQQFRDAVLDNPGRPVEAQFVDQGGVLYPADFHSLNLATAYYNFEQARTYALARGLSPEKLRGVPFYYFPTVQVFGGSSGRQVDNAAWFPLLRSFLLYPFDRLQDVPLAMNQGVVAHEYGHGLFNAEVFDGAWIPGYLGVWCTEEPCEDERGIRMIGILEEGFADAWGVGVTGDPRFMRHSFFDDGDARNPSGFFAPRHCSSQAAFEQKIQQTRRLSRADSDAKWGEWEYQFGTVLAGALYRAGQDAGYDRVMDALLASYRASGPTSLGAIVEEDPTGATIGNFATVARAVIGAAPDTPTQRALCAAWIDRLALDPADLGPLCDGVVPNGECGR